MSEPVWQQCVPYRELPDDEFQISVDLDAFDAQFLKHVKQTQISVLSVSGAWKSSASKYEDANVDIDKTITVKQDVQYLYLSHRRINRSICSNVSHLSKPVVYVSLVFKRQVLPPGRYHSDENYVILSGSNLVIVNMPQESRPTMARLVESDFDLGLLTFMAHERLKV